MSNEEMKARRDDRLNKVISLNKADHVPFAPIISGFYMYGYDISPYDAMADARNLIPGVLGYLRDYEPDAIFLPGLYGSASLETMGTSFIKWPGPDNGLPLNSPFQHIGDTYMRDEEYPEFIQDPTHFTLTKLLPRKHKNLAGLAKLYLREVFDACFFNDLAILADPEVKSAVETLLQAGQLNKKRALQMAKLIAAISEAGFSTFSQGTFVIPFDAFADSVRGIITAVNDTLEYPDELEQVVNKIAAMNIERIVKLYKSRGAKRIFIPLHCGVDEFMSPASYKRFYWPGLKQSIMCIIENDMTPVVFCEGNYNTRLEIISDVPKGKVVYAFEKVDILRVKETVGKVACIIGNVPTSLLAFGTVEQVVSETKRQIDILAPNGGFIMSCSITLDNAKHENVRAWMETTLEYGRH
jgi:uroporphyrinogen-III decarboxylase